ncbi:putative uncharacterized protein (plasmid) [Novosphingobium sp. PP1Y]|nr:putative uncharacterized protein [Novosphingobium sp. PP1Y]
MLVREGCLREQSVLDQRQVDRSAHVGAAEAAGRPFKLIAEVPRWVAGHDVERPTNGISPKQVALRSFEDFDAFKVEQIDHRAQRPGIVHAIDIDADARFKVEGEIVLADAAHGGDQNLRRTGKGDSVLDVDVRDIAADLADARDTLLFEGGAAERRNGDRHILHVFRSLRDGDDDFADTVI